MHDAYEDTAFIGFDRTIGEIDAESLAGRALETKWLTLGKEAQAFTQITGPTSPIARSTVRLWRARHRNERIARMAPQRRALYERTVKLRAAIGPIDFDVVEAVRESREDG